MFIGHGYLIVGCKQKEEGLIKVWNLATSAHHTLPGHRGQVQCLAVAGGSLKRQHAAAVGSCRRLSFPG